MEGNQIQHPEPERLTHLEYRSDIDGLRAVAILSVVAFHAFPFWVKGGFVGVDVFFVISGFLISTFIFGNLERNTFSFLEFYRRRIRRIFPALLIVFVACYAVGWFVLLPDEYKQLGKHIAAGSGFVSNLVLWSESGYFDNAAETKPLLHLWSLGIEEQFYIVWPLLLWAIWKGRIGFLAVTAGLALTSFVLNVSSVRTDAVAAFYSPQTRVWELLVGSVLAWFMLNPRATTYRNRFGHLFGLAGNAYPSSSTGCRFQNMQAWLGAVLIVAAVVLTRSTAPFPGWWALLPTLGAALTISAGMQAWPNRVILSNRILVWFGLISFPLYLWHWPLLSFARILENGIPSRGIRVAVVLTSIALAWLTYKFVEKPIRWGTHGRWHAITLPIFMIAIGYIGYNCYEREGLGFRFDEVVRELAQYRYDYSAAYRSGSCFLDLTKGQNYATFETACKPLPGDANKPSLVLWGDSHAAQLYPGYRTTFGDRFNIIQRTSGGCPPFPVTGGTGIPACIEVNDKIFEFIRKEKPSKVVLAAWWAQGYSFAEIEKVVVKLKAAGILDIDLIGPVPQWIDSLPKQLLLKMKVDRRHDVPQRMDFGLNHDVFKLDVALFELAKRIKVNYISPINILCNEEGCLTRLGATGDSLVAKDSTHLTEMGSRYLVSRFQKQTPPPR